MDYKISTLANSGLRRTSMQITRSRSVFCQAIELVSVIHSQAWCPGASRWTGLVTAHCG